MRIGVWVPNKYLHSVRVYYEQISDRLTSYGVKFVPFGQGDALPEEVDIYWDPTCTGGKNPNIRFHKRKKPLVATVHGASNFALPHHYTYGTKKQQLKGYWINFKRKFLWNFFRNNIDGIITVSNFAKQEIVRELNLPPEKIKVAYHGYDNEIFRPVSNRKNNYFFHISVYQPVKNIHLLLEAYQKVNKNSKLPLILVVPYYPEQVNTEGVTLINHAITQKEVAEYMQHAKAFFLPSVRESFGLPLIESMAVGTPVVTSTESACEEIASGYGILCNPHHIKDWIKAFENLSEDDVLWEQLNKKSLERAADFSWDKSAGQHYEFFKSLI